MKIGQIHVKTPWVAMVYLRMSVEPSVITLTSEQH